MTRFVSFLCCMLFAVAAYAQSDVNQYSFSYSEPGYSAISGGSIYGNASTDDQRFVDPAVPLGGTVNTGIGIPIGFDFTFLDEVYNRFAINANGWISLGQSSLSPAVNISSTSNFEMPLSSTAEILPDILVSRIVGFGTDLQAQAGSELRVQTIGAAPNRELVVQWTNYKKYGDGGNGDSFSFQIRLKETTNNFSFVYGTMLNNAFVAAAQVGLRSAPATTPTNWVCRTTTDNWAATQPGSSASSTMTISSIVFPASGSSYTWAPPLNNIPPDPAVLIAPADHALDVPLTQNLSWNPTGGTVIGYKLYFGTDDPPTNLANGIDLGNNTSYRPSQLLDDETQYKWKIVPYNGIGDALDCPVWTFTTGSAIMEFPYTQDFESWVPEGWSIDEGTYDFIQYTDANSNNWAEANFWDSPQGTTYYLVSPEFYTNSNLKLGFTWSHSCHPIYPDDALTVQVSADGETWEDLWYKTQTDFDSNDGDNYTIPGTGVNVSVDIPEQYLNTYFQIRFYALSGYGSNLFIDDVCVDVAAIEPSGAGTEADPYQIASLYNLLWLSNSPDAWDSYFLQTADIDASSTEYTNSGHGFSPIGNANDFFTGVYDGAGHTISGLVINRPNTETCGLFGKTFGASLSDIHLEDAFISAKAKTGVLVGGNESTDILNCSATGEVSVTHQAANWNTYAGGLIGRNTAYNNTSSNITNCYTNVNVSGTGDCIGGITGMILAGYSTTPGGTITVSNCYAQGTVSGRNILGGLIGKMDGTASGTNSVIDCYSTGFITGTNTLGGLIGRLDIGTVSNSFWNTESSQQASSAGGTGKNTPQMQDINTYLDAAWDFMDETDNGTTDIWGINSSDNGAYPFLTWQGFNNLPATGLPPEGTGTDSDPYQISNLFNLLWLSNNPTAWGSCFLQTADIDASISEGLNSGRGFNPIGNSSNYFTGVYDGDGHTISGLVINRPTTDCIGLFGVADGADIKNLGIIGVSINGDSFTGGLVGINYVQSTISNCYSTGTVSGSSYTGGLVGRNYNQSTISYCYSTGIVSGSSFTGGLVGYQFQSTISYCYSTGIVSSSSFTGGLVGYNTEYSSIYNCYSTGTVSGDYTGGLVGYNKEYSSINNCYSTGTVSGYCTGGLVGVNYVNSTISNCYSIGTVSGSSDTGGLVGYSEDSSINNSFWDITTSGQTSSAGGTGKTTAEMQDVATYTSLSSAGLTTPWDFMGNPYDDTANEDIWAIDSGFNGGYPNLSHQNGILSLSAPVPVIVYNPPDGSVTISWEAVPSAAAYKVYYSENPGAVFPAAWTLLSHVSGDELSISDTMPASRRFYRVVATTEAVVTRYRAAKVKKN